MLKKSNEKINSNSFVAIQVDNSLEKKFVSYIQRIERGCK